MSNTDLSSTEIESQSFRGQVEISVEQLTVAVELCPLPILLLSPGSLDIVATNPAAQELLQPWGQPCPELSFFDYVPEPELPSFRASLESLAAGQPLFVDVVVAEGIGLRRFALQSVENLIVAVDQTTYVSERTTNLNYPEADPLTGLRNRRMLKECLNTAFERVDHGWGVLFIDLNDYKQVNDCFGHLVGDKVLANFAQKLQASARPTDWVFRYGGDEFVMVVNRIESEQLLRRVAQRIRQEVEVEINQDETTLVVTATVGCAMACPTLKLPEQIIDAADRDMYRSKRNSA